MVIASIVIAAAAVAAADQAVERHTWRRSTAQEIDGGVLAEITWDKGVLLMQGAVANPDGWRSGR